MIIPIISSKLCIPVPQSKTVIRRRLTEKLADMRFTLSEAEVFFNHVIELNLSMDHITVFQSRTEGWAASLRLAAISISEDHDADRLHQSFTGNHHFVLDYLVEEVLERQPKAVQSFLLQTSVLDRLCGSLCDDMMGNPETLPHRDILQLVSYEGRYQA